MIIAQEPVLLKHYFKQGSRTVIRLGDNITEYDINFKLYITTKLSNPHYTPEVSSKVVLLNFMITPQGLADQMLGIVVDLENPSLERERSELIVKQAENVQQLQKIEDEILDLLNEATGSILDNDVGDVVRWIVVWGCCTHRRGIVLQAKANSMTCIVFVFWFVFATFHFVVLTRLSCHVSGSDRDASEGQGCL